MDKKTLEALKGSIAHWERITAGTEACRGADNCALCQANADCDTCPVMLHTGEPDCHKTPYWDFCLAAESKEHADSGRFELWVATDQARAAAQRETDFLKSLFPEGS